MIQQRAVGNRLQLLEKVREQADVVPVQHREAILILAAVAAPRRVLIELSCTFAFVACAGLSLGRLIAQSSSGTITGRVLDPRALSVPGATATLTRTDTRETRTLVTPGSGDITFTSLQPGGHAKTATAFARSFRAPSSACW